jgi:outer membrane receptor for monomeric catechols
MTRDHVTVQLVNLDPVQERIVVVQGGAYAEHQFLRVRNEDTDVTVGDTAFAVRLAPGAAGRIEIEMQRYANAPTLAFPWDRE